MSSHTQKLTSPRAGTIPASIGNLTNLQKLNLRDNQLSGACVEPDIPSRNETERICLPSGTNQELKELLPNCGSIYI